MKPFTAPISDRSRELFGEYMRRYETEPSMQPFDADIGDRSRNLYGDYRARFSKRKVGTYTLAGNHNANGINWVDLVPLVDRLTPTINDVAIYQLKLTVGGAWAGTPYYRILIDGVKVYPFTEKEAIQSGVRVSLGTLSTTVRTGEQGVIQFRSDNAGDGAGETISGYIYIADLKGV